MLIKSIHYSMSNGNELMFLSDLTETFMIKWTDSHINCWRSELELWVTLKKTIDFKARTHNVSWSCGKVMSVKQLAILLSFLATQNPISKHLLLAGVRW